MLYDIKSMFGNMEKWREGSWWREIWIEFYRCFCLVVRKRRREGKEEVKKCM